MIKPTSFRHQHYSLAFLEGISFVLHSFVLKFSSAHMHVLHWNKKKVHICLTEWKQTRTRIFLWCLMSLGVNWCIENNRIHDLAMSYSHSRLLSENEPGEIFKITIRNIFQPVTKIHPLLYIILNSVHVPSYFIVITFQKWVYCEGRK